MHGLVWLKIAVTALSVWAVYVLTAIPQAYLDFKARPREPMEWCGKHGFFRRKHALPFMNTTICPRCYMEAWNNADQGKVKP